MRNSSSTQFFYIVTIFFDFSAHFLLLSFCVSFLIYLVRGIRFAILFGFSMFVGATIVYFMKLYFAVSRPLDGIVEVFGNSFPSYHATISTIFFTMLMYSFGEYLKRPWKIIFNVFCLLGIFSVSISRVYLGVHWATDVIFGVILGALISYFIIASSRKYVRNA